MTRQVFCLSKDAPLDQAMWSFRVHEIGGAPVRDADGKLIGVISRSDLVDPGRIRLGEPATVGDAMTPAVWAVAPETPVIEATRLMVAKGIHRVLVVDEQGRLAGIVTAMDVLRALARTGDLEGRPKLGGAPP